MEGSNQKLRSFIQEVGKSTDQLQVWTGEKVLRRSATRKHVWEKWRMLKPEAHTRIG